MRKTSLYISLSVLAMIAAFWLGELDRQGMLRCPAFNCGEQRAGGNSYQRMYEHAIEGRFHRAARVASRMIEHNPHNAEARLYLAYSLRGMEQHDAAVRHYSQILDGSNQPWITIDALTGRAAAHLALGNADEASLDTQQAHTIAEYEETKNASALTAYQLACIHAQKAGVYSATDSIAVSEASAQAREHLKDAIKRGYNSFRHIQNDLDLAPLRKLNRQSEHKANR